MQYHGRFRNCADHIAARDFVADFRDGGKIPFLLMIHGGDFHAARDTRADFFDDFF